MHWRVLLAKGWRHIGLLDSDYAEARNQNERILSWLPNNSEALDLKLKLDQMMLSAFQNQQLAHIRAGTEFLVQEAVAMLEPATREPLQKLLGQNADNPDGMDSILDQPNNLVQEGSKIQPAALRSASYRAINELGTDVFNDLHPDSQHFLTTAETLYAASDNVASEMDSSFVVIEYAKVVETELRNRFLPVLARGLEAERFKDKLRAGREEIRPEFRSGGHAKWERKLSNLLLGNTINLLSRQSRARTIDLSGRFWRNRSRTRTGLGT